METNWNQLIERYLNNELSAEGKTAFENELQKNTELQTEFELHKLTQELIQRNSLRRFVKQSGKWFHMKKILVNSGIAFVILGALAIAVYVLATRTESSSNPEKQELIEQSMLKKLEKQLAFENIDPEYFQFTGESDVFLSESGVLLSITDQSFLLNGKPYVGEAIVQWQEAQKASDIVKAGLSTKSGDKLLETQGMFSLNAFTPAGKKLELTKEGVYVQVPVDELKKDMMLFTGVPGKDGAIDWQNPKELDRLPKPKDMADMDLFPPKYEPKLNELKWFTEKAKRDSLYLSFEEEENLLDTIQNIQEERLSTQKAVIAFPQNQLLSGNPKPKIARRNYTGRDPIYPQDKVHWNFGLQQSGNQDAWIIATVTIEDGWEINSLNMPMGSFGIPTSFGLRENSNFQLIGAPSEPKPFFVHDKEADEDLSYHVGKIQFKQKIRLTNKKPCTINGFYSYQTCKINEYCLVPFENVFSVLINSTVKKIQEPKSHIPPSKVLAIWNKKFNNTNLATQDFEDRMKAIHETCDEKVFDVYSKNRNTPLWQLDQRVVKMGYPEFQQFADQKVGSIKLDNAHQKNLQAFYEKAIETIRETGRKNVETALKKERQWDKEVQDECSKEGLRKGLRESANLNEEYGFNLQNVYKQLGVTAGFQMHGGGTIVNIDKYVMDATIARQSTLITDPQTGKTAQITYEPMSMEVKESEKYDKLYLYLFSKEINSYQRLDFKDGILKYNLNGDMNYRAFVVGMNEQGYFYHQINELKAENLGVISLKEISEKEFDKRITILNSHRTDKPMDLKDELNWLFKEKANYAVQKKRRENAAFRKEIRPTVYSCEQQGIDDVKK
jgi:hypothetical protein